MSEQHDLPTSNEVKLTMTILDKDGNPKTYEGEQAWALVEARKPYRGIPRIKPIAACKRPRPKGWKRGERGFTGPKNPAGGRKVVFSISKEYKRRHPRARYAKTSAQLSRYEWPSGVSKAGTDRWHGWEPPAEDSKERGG